MKSKKPKSSIPAPIANGEVTPKYCTKTGLRLKAKAVPKRAIATWVPMAEANSLPRNHFVTILETVMPVMSHPMPKSPKPSDEMRTCTFTCSGIKPKNVKAIFV